jgi:hypothetical protein
VACRVGNAEIQRHVFQKGRLGQGDATGAEVRGHSKHQAVAAGGHGAGVQQRAVGVAAIGVQGERLDRLHLVAVDALQRHGHAGGGAAVHGVEHVGAEVSHR